jgi:DNA-binding transcriptional MerR regulator
VSWKPVKRIRFCGDQELLQPASRFEGRYRLFDQTVDAELALIRNVRAMGLPLSWQQLRGSAGHGLRQAP